MVVDITMVKVNFILLALDFIEHVWQEMIKAFIVTRVFRLAIDFVIIVAVLLIVIMDMTVDH